MAARYPYAITKLDTQGQIPADGDGIRANHFNRIAIEIAAIQATLGRNIQGNANDLDDRLIALNDDGSYQGEIICEDDPTNNNLGSRRYMDFVFQPLNTDNTGLTSDPEVPLRFANAITCFDGDPVVIASPYLESGWTANSVRDLVVVNTPEGTRVSSANKGGASINSPPMMAILLSAEVVTYRDDVAWVLPPIRTGS